MLTDTAIRELAEKYRFNPDAQSMTGPIGGREGVNTGSSVEVQDFRDYVPGDDPRMIDWMAYARTDRLVVRLYREEVSPFVDIIVDHSRSMGLEDGRKRALVAELSRWLFYAAQSADAAVRLYAAGSELYRVERPGDVDFVSDTSAIFTHPAQVGSRLGRAAVRVVLTDFMDSAPPAHVIRPLSRGCARLVLVRCLGPWENDPRPEGPAKLTDIEHEDRGIDINLDADTVEKYRRRLRRLTTAIEAEVVRGAGVFLDVTADKTLEQVLKTVFLPRGIIKVS